MIPVFVGCEVLSEEESEDKSTHVIERRCKLNVEAPRLLKRVFIIFTFYEFFYDCTFFRWLVLSLCILFKKMI